MKVNFKVSDILVIWRLTLTQSAFDLGSQVLWQVHTIRNGDYEQLGIAKRRPIEEVVNHILLGCQELVEFVH